MENTENKEQDFNKQIGGTAGLGAGILTGMRVGSYMNTHPCCWHVPGRAGRRCAGQRGGQEDRACGDECSLKFRANNDRNAGGTKGNRGQTHCRVRNVGLSET